MRKAINLLLLGVVLFVPAVTTTSCNFTPNPQGATPTVMAVTETAVAQVPSETPTLTVTTAPTDAEQLQPSELPQVESPTPSPTDAPPTESPTPSETPGPYEHTLQQGETLGYIIQLYGYTDFGVIDQVVALNDNIPDANRLPGAGAIILIPRQTATPTPDLNNPTIVAQLTQTTPTQSYFTGELMCHTVLPGETIVGIASEYSTTIEVLSQLNPDLFFSGCNFTIPSGGPECNVLISEGLCVNVPMPTPTPTLSPTPSGNETATPTPTYAPPMVVSPPQNAIAQAGVIRLQWVSVGELGDQEVYLVQVEDTTNAATFTQVTKDTSLLLPASLIPNDGQTHIINWRVSVARPNDQGVYRVVSGDGPLRTFQWQSQ
ncbi:MAG: LysM peptidoglycan-binding domain-containing protein [Burkholderiales bacterium]|nr:LysM peptidoglycan-binding domain-containing protein [Anaerolineae bacterium]